MWQFIFLLLDQLGARDILGQGGLCLEDRRGLVGSGHVLLFLVHDGGGHRHILRDELAAVGTLVKVGSRELAVRADGVQEVHLTRGERHDLCSLCERFGVVATIKTDEDDVSVDETFGATVAVLDVLTVVSAVRTNHHLAGT